MCQLNFKIIYKANSKLKTGHFWKHLDTVGHFWTLLDTFLTIRFHLIECVIKTQIQISL